MDENEEFAFRARAEAERSAAPQQDAVIPPSAAQQFDAGTMPQSDMQKYLQQQYQQAHTNLSNAIGAIPQAAGTMAINSLAPIGAGAESLVTGQPYSATAEKWRYSPDNPDAQALLQGVGSIPGVKQIGQAVGAVGQGVSSVSGGRISPEAGTDLVGTALMFGPAAIAGGTKAYAASKLKAAMTSGPARASGQLAQAEAYPVPLTVAQTVGPGVIRHVSTQVQGARATEVGQAQADAHAIALTQKARKLAPLPVTAPGAAANTVEGVTKAIQSMETKLNTRASTAYERGSAQVSALSRVNPQPVQFPALTAAMARIESERPNIWNTAPKELEPRVQRLLSALKPSTPAWMGPPTGARTVGPITTPTALEAMHLGKSLNQQFDTAERTAVTKAMEDTFAELKSAYKSDLENAPATPAIDRARSVNAEYSAAQGRVKTLQDSVVAETVRTLGKDPDAAIQKLADMNPHVQRYTRDMLLKYSPDTLRALQGHYIDVHLGRATPAGQNVFNSTLDIHALNPETLAKTGIFDPKTVHELNQAQASINTIRSFFPEQVGNKTGANVQEMSRLGGGALGHVASPVFGYGMLLRILSGGKLEKLLLTPEGRTALLNGASDPQAAQKLVRNIALYSNKNPQPNE